jgi:hypothetical protein
MKKIVIPIYKIGDKQKVENYSGISLLNACYKLYSKIVNTKLKTQAEHFLCNARMDSEKTERASILCLA